MDLSTSYLGLSLRSPLVASAGPLTSRIESVRALEDAGIAAVVLPSLFEEQVVHDELSTSALYDLGDGDNPEAAGYFPDLAGYESLAERYLRHVEEARRAVAVPVIGSLNGVSPGGWTRYAKLIEEAGADALELNLYRIAADPSVTSQEIEAEQLALVASVAESVDIPLAVKVGPHYSAFANFASLLVNAGASALVLFNRFYQPDLDLVTRRVVPTLALSSSEDLRLPLRWIGLLHGRIDAALAATGGVHSGYDAARALLAGADVTMMTSVLLRNGAHYVRAVESVLVTWAEEQGYVSVAELRGSASHRHVADPASFERANYIGTLVQYANVYTSSQGAGPW